MIQMTAKEYVALKAAFIYCGIMTFVVGVVVGLLIAAVVL